MENRTTPEEQCPRCKIKFDSTVESKVQKNNGDIVDVLLSKCSKCGFVNRVYILEAWKWKRTQG